MVAPTMSKKNPCLTKNILNKKQAQPNGCACFIKGKFKS